MIKFSLKNHFVIASIQISLGTKQSDEVIFLRQNVSLSY